MNIFKALEEYGAQQKKIQEYYIRITSLLRPIRDFKYLQASNDGEHIEEYLTGKWVIFRGSTYLGDNHPTEKYTAEFNEQAEIVQSGNTTLWKKEGIKEWYEYEYEYEYKNYELRLGNSDRQTLQVRYVSKDIIFALGYCGELVLFINYKAIDQFKNQEDIYNKLVNEELLYEKSYIKVRNDVPSNSWKDDEYQLIYFLSLCVSSAIAIPDADNGHVNLKKVIIWGILVLLVGVLWVYYNKRTRRINYIENCIKNDPHSLETETRILKLFFK